MKVGVNVKNKGFTLVELIAVIAIMGSLLVIAGASIYKFRDNANKKAYLNIKDNIETAIELYIESNSNDIIDKCTGEEQEYCLCENKLDLKYAENYPYTCEIRLEDLLKKGIYNNIDSTSECLQDLNKCCVINPSDNSCLDNSTINIEIKKYSSEATLEQTE